VLLKPTGTFMQVGIPAAVSLLQTVSIAKKIIWPFIYSGRIYYFVNIDFFPPIGRSIARGKPKAVINTADRWEDVPLAFRKSRDGYISRKLVMHILE
jgi:hypothetical protein